MTVMIMSFNSFNEMATGMGQHDVANAMSVNSAFNMPVVNNFSEIYCIDGSRGGIDRNRSVMHEFQVDNMSPTVHEFGNLRFDVGSEDPDKRRHVHVVSPTGEIKVWLDPIEYAPIGDKGEFSRKDYKIAMEQIERYYDDISENHDRHYRSEPIQKTKGQKVKGKNRTKQNEG